MGRCCERVVTAAAVACALLSCSVAGTGSSNSTLSFHVDAVFSDFDSLDSPGCAVGVFRAGEVLLARGYGAANLEHRVPITAQTVFDIASNSKQFTALAILLLERDGLLALDQDIRQYVPELPEYGAQITIRHLLNNTSGLRCLGDLLVLKGVGVDHPVSLVQGLDLIGRQHGLNDPPGERYVYSNTNWLLLALIVERVDGRAFRDFMREEVFVPLDMMHTEVRDDPTRLIPDRAETYRRAGDSSYHINRSWGLATGIGGMGFIHSTLEDLAKWDANFYSEKLGGDGISERLYEREKLTNGEDNFYASGLMIGSQLGLPAVFHGGAGGGSSELVRFPEQRLSVAVLCNQSSTNVDSRELTLRVAEVYLEEAGALAARDQEQEPVVAPGGVDLNAFTGLYWIPEQARRTEFLVRDGVLIEVSEGYASPLDNLGGGRFQDAWEVISFDSFGSSAHGTHRPTGERYRLIRLPAGFVLTDASRYAGSYFSEELDVTWVFRAAGDVLWLTRGPESPVALEAVDEDRFILPGKYIEFHRDTAGQIVGLHASTARVLHLEFDRVAMEK